MSTATLFIDGKRWRPSARQLLAEGGEAEVYDLSDGRVAKLWKAPAHPDFAGDPAAALAATARQATYPRKLAALTLLPLPIGATMPSGWVTSDRAGQVVVGIVLPKIAGIPLHALADAQTRRTAGMSLTTLAHALGDLARVVAGIHAVGAVIGDFNDLNVLVDGGHAALIDLDSAQLPGFPCTMWSERFVDPRLLASAAPTLAAPHAQASDWFAFAVMAYRSLCGVHPFAGVHRPSHGRALGMLDRMRAGIAVWHQDVIAPKVALPPAHLPPDVWTGLQETLIGGARAPLTGLRWAQTTFQTCAICRREHGQRSCPACVAAPATVVVSNAGVRALPLALTDVRMATVRVSSTAQPGASVWLADEQLWRNGALGPQVIGQVLGAEVHAWLGTHFGLGFYRVGGLTVGFVFRGDRAGLDDRLRLPMRGQLIRARATVGDRLAWLAWTEAHAGRLHHHLAVIDREGRLRAHLTVDDDGDDWWPGVFGAVATGDHLFVPTDDGIVRIGLDAGNTPIVVARFPATAPYVNANATLALGPRGLDVCRLDDAVRLEL